VAGQEHALRAFIDIERKVIVALFTAVFAVADLPVVVLALVVVHQVAPLPLHSVRPPCVVELLGAGIAIDDDIRAGEQPVLVPLRTIARLPLGSADVAKLGLAATGWARAK
jgi:hypothetical protein